MDNSVEKTVVSAYEEALTDSKKFDDALTKAIADRIYCEQELRVAKDKERLAAEFMQLSANKVETFLSFIKLQGWKA